jgi:hypothetical protein
MAPHAVTCPHCDKQLKLPHAPVAGRRILCPSCSRTFAALAEASPPSPGAADALPAPVTATPRRALLVAAALAALLLLAGSTALALQLVRRSVSTPEDVDRSGSTTSIAAFASGYTPSERATSAAQIDPTADEPEENLPPPAVEDVPPPAPQPPREAPAPKNAPPAAPVRAVAERAWLPPERQQLVDAAIARGVEYLQKKQYDSGTWHSRHTTGLAAVGALTLLECGVPADDPRVQKATKLVRNRVPRFAASNSPSTTYELSLALLFLDRLGDPRDSALIRTIAVRLVAGQLADGGWTYNLPVLLPENEAKILRVLERTAPRPRPLERLVRQEGKDPLDRPVRDPKAAPRPLEPVVGEPGADRKLGPGVAQPEPSSPSDTRPADRRAEKQPVQKKPPEKKPEAVPAPERVEPEGPLEPAQARKVVNGLPARFQHIPALVAAAGDSARTNPLVLSKWPSDNSNTQFATLALWVARRHDLPVDRALALAARRFRITQVADGRWRYTNPSGRLSMPMTGAGLIGLAVGHGLEADGPGKKAVKDPGVDAGLLALGSQVGKRFRIDMIQQTRIVSGRTEPVLVAPINLYLLWTVERVGVMYQVREMAGKDWYRWGVDLLLEAQAKDGSWWERGYPGSTRPLDTCFALLFLKRANLAADLTKKLDLIVGGKPAAAPKDRPVPSPSGSLLK